MKSTEQENIDAKHQFAGNCSIFEAEVLNMV